MSISDQFYHRRYHITASSSIKFEGDKSDHIGQLFVTPEMITKKIKKMKDNKLPGVDGIPPKLLKDIYY